MASSYEERQSSEIVVTFYKQLSRASKKLADLGIDLYVHMDCQTGMPAVIRITPTSQQGLVSKVTEDGGLVSTKPITYDFKE